MLRSSTPTFSPAKRLVKNLVEHFKASRNSIASFADTDELDLVVHSDFAPFYPASNYCTAARNREHVLDRHQEGLVDFANWSWDFLVDCIHQFEDRFDILWISFESLQRGSADDRTFL